MGTKEYSWKLVRLRKHWAIGEGMKSDAQEVCGTPRMGGNFSDATVWRVRILITCRRSVTLLNPSVYKHRSLILALISFFMKKQIPSVL